MVLSALFSKGVFSYQCEVELLLVKEFGDIKRVHVRNNPNDTYAFVEFGDAHDAEDAIRHKQGYGDLNAITLLLCPSADP